MNFAFDDSPDRMSIEELRSMQTKYLREHLQYCAANSPWYRELLGQRDWSHFELKDLTSLPLTAKCDLTADPSRFYAVPARAFSDIVFSSGTTGVPTPIVYTQNDMDRMTLNEERCFAAAGMTADDIMLLTCTLDRCFVAGMAYYLGARKLGAAVIRNGLNTLESHADVILHQHPTVLVGVPSFLRRLGLYLHEQKIDISSVKKLICIGEPVRNADMTPSHLGAELVRIWKASVYGTYASSEIVTSFCECTAQCGGHLLPELAIVEIVDESGNVLPDGTIGEIVVTPMREEGVPLVRFRTGDMGYLISDPCVCGRHAPRLSPILGRKAQMLKIKGTTVYPQMIYNVVDEYSAVADYYLLVEGENLSDLATLVVSLKEPTMDPTAAATDLESRLRAHCRVHIPVKVDSLEPVHNQVYGVSRKPVHFVDKRVKFCR